MVESIITQSFGIIKEKRRRDRRLRHSPPISAATKKKFFFAFLAELGNLESFEAMLFFSNIFPLIPNPVGGLSHIFQILVYQCISKIQCFSCVVVVIGTKFLLVSK